MSSIDQQIAAMEAQWPQMRLKARENSAALWEGVLAPDKREHLVRIYYRAPLVLEHLTAHDVQPRVQIIRPLLERHPDYEEGPIPHVYWSRNFPDLPYLCLFDPARGEWSTDDLLAHTTVFWAAEWLYFYEGWLVIKKWRGGGAHSIASQSTNGGQKQLEAV
jgi:hypothetical protein